MDTTDKINQIYLDTGTTLKRVWDAFTTCNPDRPFYDNCVADRTYHIANYMVKDPKWIAIAVAVVFGVLGYRHGRKLIRDIRERTDQVQAAFNHVSKQNEMLIEQNNDMANQNQVLIEQNEVLVKGLLAFQARFPEPASNADLPTTTQPASIDALKVQP